MARLQAAAPALADGWGQPQTWLEAAQASFAAHGIDALAARCAELLGRPRPGRWTGLGVTAREADVLVLVAEGLANKEIAARLHVSPRTVEKHVESLMRKAGARSRTQLGGHRRTSASRRQRAGIGPGVSAWPPWVDRGTLSSGSSKARSGIWELVNAGTPRADMFRFPRRRRIGKTT